MSRSLAVLILALTLSPVFADGPSDNQAVNVRRIPPAGVAIPDEARASLTEETEKLGAAIAALRGQLAGRPEKRLLPDVVIFHKAVDWALRYDEFYDPGQVDEARELLKEGFSRLEALGKGTAPWLEARGLVVRGYESKIDGSVQPFGLVVPESFQKNLPYRWRLDCWFHGRGEKLTELNFLHQRRTQAGEFSPVDTIVLHPYGRYCNGSRFAGETDFFEALETVKRDYRVDEDRVAVRGFSLGGAACWHIATHHSWMWAAANPGAGFSETEKFLNFFQGEALQPAEWERKLWNLYDSTAVADNILNVPTVAYSGETDKQKQAADLMAEALKKEGGELAHVIGPKTAHQYEPGAKAEVARRVDKIVARGRDYCEKLDGFSTYSLRTNRSRWIVIDMLEEHWKKATIRADIADDGIIVSTENVTAFTLEDEPGDTRLGFSDSAVTVTIDGQALEVDRPVASDGSWKASFRKNSVGWEYGTVDGLRKKHGLQGPVDDAFMDKFLFVRPTGPAANEKAAAWVKAEMERAIEQWRRQFRGDVRIKDDKAVTPEDIATSNLVLWGEPSSNSLMTRIAPRLPVRWTGAEIRTGTQTFSATGHALICVYPNPLNPERYVVFNSGFTFREYDALNNARQTPKLPDWAVIDLSQPADARTPGRIAAADFFNEVWELKIAP